MKKNIKKSNSNKYTSNQIEIPEVSNMDALSYFDDDSLERLHNHLQNERERVSRHTEDLVPWETEICYVQRELKIRSARRAAHDRYLKANPDSYYYDSPSNEEYEQMSN